MSCGICISVCCGCPLWALLGVNLNTFERASEQKVLELTAPRMTANCVALVLSKLSPSFQSISLLNQPALFTCIQFVVVSAPHSSAPNISRLEASLIVESDLLEFAELGLSLAGVSWGRINQ